MQNTITYFTNRKLQIFVFTFILSLLTSIVVWQISVHTKNAIEIMEYSKGGGKNDKHSNEKARDSAKKMYEKAKQEFEKLNSKFKKSKEDIKLLEKLKRQMKHWKSKMDNVGENHSQKPKGN